MSKSEKTQSTVAWREGLTASAIKGTESNLAESNRRVLAGEASLLRAGRNLRTALQSHLRNDKARFALACAELFDRGASIAYEYVQAADAADVFGGDIAKAGIAVESVGVRTLAELDRFTADDDTKAEGRKIIASDVAKAKAEGRKPLTNAGLSASIAEASGKTPTPATDRRVARIAGVIGDDMATNLATFSAMLAKSGERAAFLYAFRQGTVAGAANGAATAEAVTTVGTAWLVAEKKAKAEADAAELANALANAKAEAAKGSPKPAARVTAKATAPRRSVLTDAAEKKAAEKAKATKATKK